VTTSHSLVLAAARSLPPLRRTLLARYALVEAVAAALAALIFWTFVVDAPGEPLGIRAARFATYFTFAAVLLVLSFIDLDTKRLPDIITLPAIAVFFLAGFAVHDVSWSERAIGAAAGYLLVRIVADGYYYVTGREGLGLGDGKLLAIMAPCSAGKPFPPSCCWPRLRASW